MYINKFNYYLHKILYLVGVNFFGFLGTFVLMGIGIDFAEKGYTTTPVIACTIIICTIWVLFLRKGQLLKKTKIYNSFFANDADGVMYVKVIAKSLGIDSKKAQNDIALLIQKKYIRDCSLKNDQEDVLVILTNHAVTAANRMRYRVVKCPHCGGENQIREGFVYGCRYCSGRVE